MKDIEALTDTFTRLLLLSEHRGLHATGVAWVKRDGSMQVAKDALPARQFVQTGTYLDWLLGVDRQVTYLMGHTRWPTRGSALNPANNHPLVAPIPPCVLSPGDTLPPQRAGQVALSHNGHIANAAELFHQLGLPRSAQVDSELLVRLAQRHAGSDGVDMPAFLAELAPLDGRMSLALVATTRPEEIILLKGNMPLEVRIYPCARMLVYASEAGILDRALIGKSGWEPLQLAHGEGLVINTQAWTMQHVPFSFQGLNTIAGASYTGVITRKERSR